LNVKSGPGWSIQDDRDHLAPKLPIAAFRAWCPLFLHNQLSSFCTESDGFDDDQGKESACLTVAHSEKPLFANQ
jgi:hypothetical protein